MSDELITIATYDDPANAHIVQARLESEGVDSYLLDENVAAMFWHYNAMTRGIKLQVKQSDAPTAHDIITEHRPQPVAAAPVAPAPTPLRCPHCGSFDITGHRPRRWPLILLALAILIIPLSNALTSGTSTNLPPLRTIAVAIFLFIFLTMLIPKKCTCRLCQHRWKKP